MGRRVRVLHILWSGRIGGTEEYIFNLVKRFDPEKYEITLCFLKERGELFEEISNSGKLRVDFIGIRNGYDIVGAIRFGIYLLRNRFDIIHSHMRNILSTGILSLCAFTTPKVLTHHRSPGDIKPLRKDRLFYSLFTHSFEKILAISTTVKKSLSKECNYKYPERIEVVYNGIDTLRFNVDIEPAEDLLKFKQNKKWILGFIGRVEGFKRPTLFVKIAIEIIKKVEGYHFVMVGDGRELNRCKEMVGDYGIGDHFTFLGFRREIPQILKTLDALLFTSRGEGFGIVLIEAMAMGVPVFAVNDGAVSEIIRDRGNGILLNTADPEIIAKEIIEVLTDNHLINKIKSNAVNDAVNRFSIEASVKKTERIYNELLKRHQV